MSNWIKPYIQQNKGRMTVTIFLGLLGVSSGAMLLFISGYLISKSALRPENVMAVYVPIVATRAFSIGQAVFHYVRAFSWTRCCITHIRKDENETIWDSRTTGVIFPFYDFKRAIC